MNTNNRQTYSTTKSVAELAAIIGGRVRGDGEVMIERVADLKDATTGAISFVENAKLIDEASCSQASCLIVPPDFELPEHITRIEVAQPKLAFARIARVLHPPQQFAASIHATAIVGTDAELAADVYIAAHVRIGARARIGERTQIHTGGRIGDDVTIGNRCVIHDNVVVYENVVIGDNVILHAGAVIGADGFGYVRDGENGYVKFPQIGTVIIEDDVEIGANSCVDRGALGATRIGRGTKIDNLVQVAHNVQIGERVVIAAQTGISGSCIIEDDCIIGGQVGIADHARLRRGAIVGAQAGVLPGKIVRGAAVMWGTPARPLEEFKRTNAMLGRLPQMREELERLRRQVDELAKSNAS